MRRVLVALAWLLLAAGGGAHAAAGTDAEDSLLPKIERALNGPCIADPATMRRHHMDLLKHQRWRTVHLGERGAAVSLERCVDCHASKTSGSVAAAPGDFCVSCHAYAAVRIDCFECHASRPAAHGAVAAEARP
ncbi:MAG: hypothetical protein KGL43_04075 [Burkholderiales bacterium]|nr:hypothetical protein [Burkholderiales bacterium]